MSHPDRHNPANDAELDIAAVLDIVFKNAWRIVLIAATIALLGTAWAFMWPPKYQADILIQIEDSADSAAAGGLLGDVSSLFDIKSSAAAEAQIVVSRLVVSRAVEKLHLHIDATPVRVPLIGDFVARTFDTPPRPGLFGFGNYAWGHEHAEVTRFDVPKPMVDERFTLEAAANGYYELTSSWLDKPLRGRFGKELKAATPYGPVVINVARIDALPGVRFALFRHGFDDTVNALQQRLDVQEKMKQSGVIVATLLGRDAQRTGDTLREIGEQYVRQNIERKYADAAQSLRYLTAQLPALRQKLEAAQARYTQMRNERGVVDLSAETTAALQQQADSRAQLVMLQQKRAELVERYTPIHPNVVATDEQIAILHTQIDRFDNSLRRLPDIEQDAARLMLDVKVNTDLYTTTLNNTQQLQLVKAGKVGSVRMIDTPVVLDVPTWPKRPLVIVAALLTGLLAGFAYAFAREFLYGGVNSAEEIERSTGLPVLASITMSSTQSSVTRRAAGVSSGRVHVLASEAPHDQAVECLRSLRTALRMSLPQPSGKVVLITSAAPDSGKSFLTANLSAVIASMGQRVLLVDCDMRRPSLHPMFGVGRTGGWSDLLAGQIGLAAAVRRIDSLALDFIAAGSPASDAAELLLSPRATEVFESIRSAYDYVLIDTPPLLAVEDAATLAAHANAVLLVARAGTTRSGELRESLRRLERGGATPAGIVLNGVPLRSARSAYGAYHYANYHYDSPVKTTASTPMARLRAWLRQS